MARTRDSDPHSDAVEQRHYEPLGHLEDRFWKRDDSVPAGGRMAGRYRVFVPAQIASRRFVFSGDTADAIVRATAELQNLQHRAQTETHQVPLGLLRTLLRLESAASSRIEGKQISQRNLARAGYLAEKGRGHGDPRAAEVFGNVEAMERAIEIGSSAGRLTSADVMDIHRTLLRFTVDNDIAGVLRDRQNWIGGSDYHPIGAVYVGPPADQVPELINDLCLFAGRVDIPAIAQAAIVHAQFENIHPFADGNGRVGRALIYAVLKRRGLLDAAVPPVSLVLGAAPKNYISGLGVYSGGNVDRWCASFADVVAAASARAQEMAASIAELQDEFVLRIGRVRSDAAVLQLIRALPAYPVLDIASMTRQLGKSTPAVSAAVDRLARAGIVVALNERKWGRVWECPELFTLLERFEADLQRW